MEWAKVLFRQHTVIRYLFVGGTSYIFELSALLALYRITGSRTLAAAVSFLVGFSIAFVLQKLVAFQDFNKELKAIGRQSTFYILLNVWNYLFTIGFVTVFPARQLIISRTVALVLMSCWNYFIYKRVIFKRNA